MRGSYKSVKEFYNVEHINNQKENQLKERFIDQREKQRLQSQQRHERYTPDYTLKKVKFHEPLNFDIPNNSVPIEKETGDLNIKLEVNKYTNTSSPKVWGPPLWFTLHNSASKYPMSPSAIVREKMKNIIIGLPVLLPCEVCKEHATAYIEKYFDQLDEICSTRDNLFKFFVDFHNKVNERHDKPLMTYETAYKLYNNGTVNIFSYS
jgi:hypothetical protein